MDRDSHQDQVYCSWDELRAGLSVAGAARGKCQPTSRPKTNITTFFRVLSWSISFGDSPLPDQVITFDDQDFTSIVSRCCQDQDSHKAALLHLCDKDQYCWLELGIQDQGVAKIRTRLIKNKCDTPTTRTRSEQQQYSAAMVIACSGQLA